MTEQIQLLQHRLECISRHLKVLWIALKDFSMHLGGNRRLVPLKNITFTGKKVYSVFDIVDQRSRWLDIEQASTSQRADTARNPANSVKIRNDFLVHSLASLKCVYLLSLLVQQAQYMLCSAKVACGQKRRRRRRPEIRLCHQAESDDFSMNTTTKAAAKTEHILQVVIMSQTNRNEVSKGRKFIQFLVNVQLNLLCEVYKEIARRIRKPLKHKNSWASTLSAIKHVHSTRIVNN